MTQRMLPYLTITFVIALLAWLAWHHLPIGRVLGYTIYPKDWEKTRVNREWEECNRKVAAVESLPPHQRAESLLKLFEEYRSQPLLHANGICWRIIALGQDDLLPFVKERLSERHYLSSVITGVEKAVEVGGAQPHFKVQCFQMLLPFLDRKNYNMAPSGADELPNALFLLDADWAKHVLTSPEYLTLDHHLLKDVLIALRKHKINIPQSLIDSWLANMDRASLGYKGTMAYIEVANIIGTYDHEKADQLLVRLIHIHTDTDEHVADARLKLRELPHPRFQLNDKKTQLGFDALNPHERTAWLVDEYNYQYSLGGLNQFEQYEELERLPLMIDALVEVKAHKSAEELRQYFAIFGSDGITPESIQRKYLSDTTREDYNNKIEQLQSADIRQAEGTSYLVLNYILEHPQHFDAKSGSDATNGDPI